MTKSVKLIQWCCCALAIFLLTVLYPLPTARTGLLHDAAKKGDIAKVKQLISDGADVNAKNQRGRLPLFLAASTEIVRLLIEKGADFNIRTAYRQTPLSRAIQYKYKEVTNLLRKHGAKE